MKNQKDRRNDEMKDEMKTQKGTIPMEVNEMSVPMPPELREKIRDRAKKLMISEAGVVRVALIEYFDSLKPKEG